MYVIIHRGLSEYGGLAMFTQLSALFTTDIMCLKRLHFKVTVFKHKIKRRKNNLLWISEKLCLPAWSHTFCNIL